MLFCFLAFFIGTGLSWIAPAGQFAAGLLVVTLTGFGASLALGLGFGTAVLEWAALFASTQVGYVAGLGLQVARAGGFRRTAPRRQGGHRPSGHLPSGHHPAVK